VAGRLTTHVLDTSRGLPAAGVAIELRRTGEHQAIRAVRTNADGRTDEPLLEGDELVPGGYELRFAIGAYFASPDAFFDVVPVRITIVDATRHYHVPLLASPYAYSTYRGS
jgi:5-hydroxyisourate hydrolase